MTNKHQLEHTPFHRNVSYLILYRCLMMALPATLPIIIQLWSHRGLSVSDVAMLQLIFSVAMLSLEVPTGYLADLINRKATMAVGALISIIGTMMYPMCISFWDFTIIEIILGLSFALSSGADQAMCYDSLLALNREHEFNSVWGRMKMYELIVLGIGNILAGTLNIYSFYIPFWAASVAYALAFLCACRLVEPPREGISSLTVRQHFGELSYVSKLCLLKNVKIRWAIAFSSVLFGFCQGALWFYQPYWDLSKVNTAWFGLIFCSCNLLAGAAARSASTLSTKMGLAKLSTMLLVLLVLGYFLPANIVFVGGFIFAFLHQIVRGIMSVIYSEQINRNIESKYRATAASIHSMCMRSFYSLLLLFIGITADHIGLLTSLNILGSFLLILGVFVLKSVPKER